jgi:hypothetical protein
VCVGERYNRYGTRLLLRLDGDRVCSVPREWTDVIAPDPDLVVGERRALLRLSDLLGLAELVARLVEQERPGARKAKDAATVKVSSPHSSSKTQREAKECKPTIRRRKSKA